MAKLTKTELEALSYKIKQKLNAPIKEYNKRVDEKAEQDFKESEIYQKLIEVKDYFEEDESVRFNQVVNINSALSKFKENIEEYQTEPLFRNNSDIYRELVIQQIDCRDLDSLIEKVTEHFKNQN